ncbi:DUF1104 domain-containing protein [Campylobacter blaseri]|uniref:DUF1104 domain-containing protein n=1 Tax=Campylobacter blaseri TaxID=2042961 RepID=A0A2P8R3G2_9BACT|nr:DUF1104 domain-containing protein [Campylobacter blaseri]PSM53033.1 hypothetical protein CQ405_00315 [Campylobacter blaseri]PSM54500.1 hypothetical protein CRN67_00315 [Campylobacter blaseri]QKF85252.1 DUF1104 domain-containing protein [Campylobacter blaseri]
MKRLSLVAILIAGSMFAASISDSSNTELYSMVKDADAKTLSDVSFEVHKRAGKLNSQAKEIKQGFKDEMHKKISSMSDEDRAKFMQEYKKNMNEKIDSLTVKEAREMGFGGMGMGGQGKMMNGECKKMSGKQGGMMCQKMMSGKGMMMQGQGMKKGMMNHGDHANMKKGMQGEGMMMDSEDMQKGQGM